MSGNRADRVTGIVLIVLGALVAIESWRMPRMAEFGASVWAAPGIVPGAVGSLLAVMGAVLFARARRSTDAASVDEPVVEATDVDDSPLPADSPRGALWRVLLTLALCIGFAAGLVGRVPFAFGAFGFMALFILYFDRRDRQTAAVTGTAVQPLGRIVLALAVAAAAAALITTVFQDVFFVRLP